MRKNIIVILCCIILGSFTGTFFFYQIQKLNIKKSIAELIDNGIEKEDLVTLKFSYADSKSKLRWEHSKEFEYNNQMYDIVEVEYKEDSVIYLCWHDKEETKINNQIERITNLVLPNKAKENYRSQKNIHKNLYCEFSINNIIDLHFNIFKYGEYKSFYISIFSYPLTPPPNKIA